MESDPPPASDSDEQGSDSDSATVATGPLPEPEPGEAQVIYEFPRLEGAGGGLNSLEVDETHVYCSGGGCDPTTRLRNGSSPAAALVAGAAALYLERFPNATHCDVKRALVEAATTDTLTLTGHALESNTPNRLLYIGALTGGHEP